MSASTTPAKLFAALAQAAAWTSAKLSLALAVGLLLIPLLTWIPPFLAPRSTAAAPVVVVRTVPVPYLDAKPEAPATAPSFTAKDAAARILKIARRSKARQTDKREAESGALGKAGADPAEAKPAAGAKADPKAAPADAKARAPADTKSAATTTVPPEPDEWSGTEIIAALRDCLRRLAPLGAEVEIAQPVKQERCGAPAPVVLRRLGTGPGRVELQPAPTINCAMVASLHAWAEKVLQPAAQELLGSPVVRILQMSGYACRTRIGTAFHADRLSEHALANAIDIAGFVTADGRTIDVLGKWGPTVRDLREAQEKAWEAVQAAKAAAKQAEIEAAQAAALAARTGRGPKREEAAAAAKNKREEAQRRREEVQQKDAEWRKALARTAEMQKLGRGADTKAAGGQAPRLPRGGDRKGAAPKGAIPVSGGGGEQTSAEALFLRRLHKGACGIFGTVLGPDANEAHRNHFHFDLAARKRSAFCE